MHFSHVQLSQLQVAQVQLGPQFWQVQVVSVVAALIVVLLGVLVGVQEDVRYMLVQ